MSIPILAPPNCQVRGRLSLDRKTLTVFDDPEALYIREDLNGEMALRAYRNGRGYALRHRRWEMAAAFGLGLIVATAGFVAAIELWLHL